jgi:uncharacterized small protein (DUF1192 family)
MAFMDDDRPKPPPVPHRVGEDLSRLSEAELAERIGLLTTEIVRIEAALKAKRAGREAAAAHFKS